MDISRFHLLEDPHHLPTTPSFSLFRKETGKKIYRIFKNLKTKQNRKSPRNTHREAHIHTRVKP